MASCDETDVGVEKRTDDSESSKKNSSIKDLTSLIDEYYHNFSKSENNVVFKYLEYSEKNEEMVCKMENCQKLIQKFEAKLDKIKNGMEKMGVEFDTIRQNSVEINHCISNRTAVLSAVKTYMDDIAVTKEMIQVLVNDSVSSIEFKDTLGELIKREKLCKEYDAFNAKSVLLLKRTLQKLGSKVINRIKEFIIGRINLCKAPSSNYAIIQNSLLSSKFLLSYLRLREEDAYKIIREQYIDTMRTVYFSSIRNYYQNLQKKFDSSLSANSKYLLGSQKKITEFGNLASFALSADRIRSDELFLLGETKKVLCEEFLLEPYIIQLIKSDTKLSAEKIFRSLLYSLICNCQAEIEFIKDFFEEDETFTNQIFEEIFGRCFQSFLGYMDKFLSNSPDLIVLIVCICLVNRYIIVLASKSLNIAIKYLSSILEMLWFRFNEVFNRNLKSFDELEAPSPTELSLTPHFVTQRSANLLSSLISLRGETKFPRLEKIIHILIKEVTAFIHKCADNYKERLDRFSFLGNNFYLIRRTISSTTCVPLPEGFSFNKANQKFTYTEYREEVINDTVFESEKILESIINSGEEPMFTKCQKILASYRDVKEEQYRETYLADLEKLIALFLQNYQTTIKRNINMYKSWFVFREFNQELVQRYLNRYLRSYNQMIHAMNENDQNIQKLSSSLPDIQAFTIEIQNIESSTLK